MVARPPLKLSIEPMGLEDVADVHRIEAASFPTPWPDYAFRQEIQTNRLAHYLVVKAGDETIGYGGMWLMVDEAHVTTFAVLPDLAPPRCRRAADARDDASRCGCQRPDRDPGGAAVNRDGARAVRQVRLQARGHPAALLLGQQRGRADHDDTPIASDEMIQRLADLEQIYAERDVEDGRVSATGKILAVETSCDETAVAVVENGRRIVANVVASQVALHSATGGIVPEVAARAHLRWMIPVLEQAREQAGITDWSELEAVAVTEGPGLAGSLLVGITMAKTLAWVHDLPLVPVNHLEGHIYAAWLLDPNEDDRPAPEFPVVALVVSGGHTFLVEMKDSLSYRLLGQTVDDAAGEAFDKVGRLLGLPYPGGPAIMKAAAGASRVIASSRAPGWATRTTFRSAG